MPELEYIHPSQIRPAKPLSPLAKAFLDALMEVDIEHTEEGNDAIETAIADAIDNYNGIGLDPRAIIGRLIHHL